MNNNLIKAILAGAAMAVGVRVGNDIYDTAKNPVKRAQIKKKFNNVKAALKKEAQA